MSHAPQTDPPSLARAELSSVEPSVPAATACLNCGSAVTREYCPECGQRSIDPNPTLREFGHELAEGFLNWDGKLLGTLRLLVTAPGALTCEYLAGRRVRFISPLRVYLTCSVLFFFVKAVLPDAPLQVRTSITLQAGSAKKAPSPSTQSGIAVGGERDDELSERQLDSLAASGRGVTNVWWRHFASALRKKAALSAAVSTNVPRMMFVLVPIFAALVALVFRDRRMRYPQHLTFALHTHAFLFLALIPTLVPRVVKSGTLNALLVSASFALIGAHLVLATRRVYEVGTGGALARSALISAAYFVIFTMTFLALFILSVFLV